MYSNTSIPIGIDIGTSSTCIGTWNFDRVSIVRNELGKSTTPSHISFLQTDIAIGEEAINQSRKNPMNTIFDFKRIIGRNFNEEVIQKGLPLWPFKIEEGENGKPAISVNYKGESKRFYPEQIASIFLAKFFENSKEYFKGSKLDAVIAVPAYFSVTQREATREAGKLAGLNVLKIVNEPTSAAIAYGLSNKSSEEKNIMVFDLGGGTFDVSILSIKESAYTVKATAGHSHLGGTDLDFRLMEYCIQDFKNKTGHDIRTNPKALRLLKSECEKAKIIMSNSYQAVINLDGFNEEEDFNIVISRAKFEDLCKDIFKNCLILVEKVLNEAIIEKDKIDDIIFVGGSTKIPKIGQLLKEFFNGKDPKILINPDETVAYGATIQASMLTGYAKHQDLLLLDVSSISVGVEIQDGICHKIIHRNTTIPVKKSQIFTTTEDAQQTAIIKIYEGEEDLTKDCRYLGNIFIDEIPNCLKGEASIEITFDYDANGILNIFATEMSSGKSKSLVIGFDSQYKIKESVSLEESKKQDQIEEIAIKILK